MRSLGPQSLTHRFFVYMTIVGILPLTAVAAATYFSLSESFLERALADQANILRSDREQVILIQEQVESLIDNISGVELIRRELVKPFDQVTAFRQLSTEARIGSILNGYLNVKGIVSIHLFGPNGAHFRVGDTLDFDDEMEMRARGMIERARMSGDRIHWAGIEENINQRSRSRFVLPAIKLLYETDRDTLERLENGVVVVNYSADHLSRQFTRLKSEQTSRELLLDQFRRVVASTRPLRADPPESRALHAAFAAESMDDTVEVEGRLFHRVRVPIERSDWLLVSITPRDAILAGLLQLRNRTALALVLALAFVVWFSLRFSRSVVGPVSAIARSFKRLNEGARDVAAHPVRGGGEIAELTTLFNRFLAEQSERERVNKAAREAAEVFAVSSEGIVITDTDGTIKLVNPAFTRITGYRAEEAIGRNISMLKSGRHDQDFYRSMWRSLREHGHWEGEIQNRRRNGEIYPEWQTISSIRDDAGNPLEYVAMFADITQRKQEESERARLQREVDQSHKLQALGQLTGGIAHDFNNILGIIMGYTSLALRKYGGRVDQRLLDYLGNVMSASERARNLIGQMLTYSRSEIGEVRTMQLAPAIDDSVGMLRSIIPSSIALSFEAEEALPDVAMDPVGLQQMVMNLCLNARDAMGGSGTIALHLRRRTLTDTECAACHRRFSGDWVELSVADTGSGIDPRVIEHLFEPFFTTKEVGKGVGMGLAVVYGIIQRLDGHVLVESEANVGSVFRLLFPPASAGAPPVPTDIEADAPLDAGGNGRVLVVDDEPELASLTAEALADYGHQCTVATRSEQALELLAADSARFDLVITDQTMPGLTGVELVGRMRDLGIDLPVILVTGYSDAIDPQRAMEMGIEFMKKPVDPDRLARLVAAALSTSSRGAAAG